MKGISPPALIGSNMRTREGGNLKKFPREQKTESRVRQKTVNRRFLNSYLNHINFSGREIIWSSKLCRCLGSGKETWEGQDIKALIRSPPRNAKREKRFKYHKLSQFKSSFPISYRWRLSGVIHNGLLSSGLKRILWSRKWFCNLFRTFDPVAPLSNLWSSFCSE